MPSEEIFSSFANRDTIDAALSLLSVEDRELLIQALVAGLSIPEIALKRGVSAVSLRARSSRAMKKIRKNRKN